MARALVCTIGFYPEQVLEGLAEGTEVARIITEAGVDRCAEHVQKAKEILEGRGIKVKVVKCNIFDPDECFRTLDVIFTELGRDYSIDFNLAMGSRVVCAMGYAVAAIHGQPSYSVKWPRDHAETPSPRIAFHPLPSLPRGRDEDILVVLNFLAEKEAEFAKNGQGNRGATRKQLKAFLDRNCRPRIPEDEDTGTGTKHQQGAQVRTLVDRLERERYVSVSSMGRRDLDEIHLDELGKRVQRLYGHRVPASAINICDPSPPRRGRK